MAVYKNTIELIGSTPIIKMGKIEEKYNLEANIYAKMECFNPGGSIKDRIAKEMIFDAIEKGALKEGAVIIEPTSGNTGIGLSLVGRALGFKVMIVMPESMSVERRQMIKAYGAELVLTEASKGMKGAIQKANELHEQIPNSFIPSQFENQANPLAHYKTTGKEIYDDLNGKIDIVVSGVGTGGTITGIGKYLKEKKVKVQMVAVEPASSAVLSGEASGPHKIQGIGAGFIPNTLDTTIIDKIVKVTDDDAFLGGKSIRDAEGILVGISSGAAMFAAIELAKLPENKGKNIVVILPDSGDRYLSTPLFN